MIVLDLEWNRGYDKKPLNEILQIGALRQDRLGGPVLDTFNAYIRPIVHKRLDPGARSLPELAEAQRSELDFITAMERFRAWCGPERVFALWGGDDFSILAENCAFWGIPELEAERVCNFQGAFSWLLGTEQQIALWRAAEYCGIPDTFTFHNALNDALYTALIGGWLTEEALAWQPEPREIRRLTRSLVEFPKQPRQKVGPCPTPEAVLDAREGRNPPCPLCGQRGCVSQWYSAGGGPYYSVFACPEHGRFLCRLTLTRLENGLWQGRRTVPFPTPDVLQEFCAARRGGVHPCRRQRRRRKRRRSRKK